MTDQRSLICVTCPMGCSLDVLFDPDREEVEDVQGSGCRRAWFYAQMELAHPTRMVTTTVPVLGGMRPLLPVHTAAPVPKPMIFPLLRELRRVEIRAPVRRGQVILADGAGTGIDVVASRDMPIRIIVVGGA